jgi:dTDP-4-dehydrorhamnose reductase
MDITDADAVNAVVKDFQPDVIIHGAAMTHVDQCEQNKELAYQLNVIGD